MKEWSGYKKMELLYRGTRDGMNSQNFHNKCDNKGPNYVLIQNNKENILVDFHLSLGKVMEVIKMFQNALYLL